MNRVFQNAKCKVKNEKWMVTAEGAEDAEKGGIGRENLDSCSRQE